MKLFDFIGQLQDKPYHVRIQILWISVILTMVIIVTLWLFYLQAHVLSSEPPQESSSTEIQQIPSLFGSIKNDFLLLADKLQAKIKDISGTDNGKQNFEVEIIRPGELPQ